MADVFPTICSVLYSLRCRKFKILSNRLHDEVDESDFRYEADNLFTIRTFCTHPIGLISINLVNKLFIR